ncbi:hypothetical protein H072_2338 [Dactylellina haptotyla CBS 200.50]|uniref:Uncharacterized protein n=1 Tax=Dactylellina haptotyla (strain CBS 200.50) TaxID=1284197 RepID=S8BVR1_DACHA|nr:hypothetical protein H072_2338 [Dactylellina haptotyla CBS 200.50]
MPRQRDNSTSVQTPRNRRRKIRQANPDLDRAYEKHVGAIDIYTDDEQMRHPLMGRRVMHPVKIHYKAKKRVMPDGKLEWYRGKNGNPITCPFRWIEVFVGHTRGWILFWIAAAYIFMWAFILFQHTRTFPHRRKYPPIGSWVTTEVIDGVTSIYNVTGRIWKAANTRDWTPNPTDPVPDYTILATNTNGRLITDMMITPVPT